MEIMEGLEENSDGYLQIQFVAKQHGISVPNAPLALPSSSTVDELNSVLKQLNGEGSAKNDESVTPAFEFLVNEILLRSSLKEFVAEHHLGTEKVIEVECVLREPAPAPDSDLKHEDWVGTVLTTPNLIISGCYDNSINVWSRSGRNQLIRDHENHVGAVKCVTLVPSCSDDTVCFATGSQDQSVLLWDYKPDSNALYTRKILKGHERSVEAICSNKEGSRLASGGFDSFLKIWKVENDPALEQSVTSGESRAKKRKQIIDAPVVETPMVTLQGHKEAVTGVDWSTSPGEVITASMDHSIIAWDLELPGQKSSLNGNKAFTSVSCSKITGLVVTGSVDNNVRLWDLRSKEGSVVKRAFSSHSGWVSSVDWSKTNEFLFASGSYDCTMKMWDTRSPKAPLFDLTGHEDRVLCCDWSCPDLLVSGSADSTVKAFKR